VNGLHATAKGVLSVSSSDGSKGTVKVGPIQVSVSSSTANQASRSYSDHKGAIYAARFDTILLFGASHVEAGADANVFNGRGEANSGIAAASAGFSLVARCTAPCTKTFTFTMR
jgi:hypothetical protein